MQSSPRYTINSRSQASRCAHADPLHNILGLDQGRTKGETPRSEAEQARSDVMQGAASLALMLFSDAFEVWLELHRQEIKDRTYRDYQFYGRNLKGYFGSKKLSEIHIGHIVEYRKQRGAGAEIVNHEICALKQVMEMAGLWDLIEKFYKPLRRPRWTPPKVLTADEEERFFRVVALAINAYHDKNPTKYHPWAVAYWAVSLTNNTSAAGAELRNLRLKDLLLDHNPPKIHIDDETAKNEFRGRRIPLNGVALKQVQRLLERAKSLGASKPDHYLFPYRDTKTREYHVHRPASPWFIRTAFRSMRKALGDGFEWLNPYRFRNQLLTKLFESGAPDQVIIDIAGHSAIGMSREYSRIRIDAKYEALQKIAPKSTGEKGEAEDAG